MVVLDALNKMTEEEKYNYMIAALESLMDGEEDALTNLCNASAILKATMDRCNWAGFYLMKAGELVLGPFQGLPACNRIKVGRGVCGTAVKDKKIQRIDDVHQFPGHIACDSASNSEIVIPIIKDDIVYGVLDIDSPEFARFTEIEEKYLVKFVEKLEQNIDFSQLI
jgi:GAF domain-containing protein